MIILMISFFYLIDYIMDRTPATQNQKLLMDIQYNLHNKPDVIKQDIVIVEDEEPIKSWFWNS